MNKIYEIESGSYHLFIEKQDDRYIITKYEGGGNRLLIPEVVTTEDGDIRISEIAAKVFFANKGLREVYLPASIDTVGSWAFAGCENLRQFVLMNQQTVNALGKGVFDKCHRIENIMLGYEEPDDLSALMAAVIHRMPAEYLLKDEDIGNEVWFSKWDQCLSTFLNEPDIDGYTDLVLCGEEDIFYNEPDFAVNKRRKKSSLCMLRLLYPQDITDTCRQKFTEYILTHNKGCQSSEAWEEILENHGEDTAYFKLLFELGGITKENIDDMLLDMGEYHAEAKAYMLAIKQEYFSDGDFFDEFEL